MLVNAGVSEIGGFHFLFLVLECPKPAAMIVGDKIYIVYYCFVACQTYKSRVVEETGDNIHWVGTTLMAMVVGPMALVLGSITDGSCPSIGGL